ncbi:COG4705 family protein [Aequorivita vladivostokensis]|uniref:Membrane protein n=1 Tax=Aequorivita vladivostokensis TaxID=171194 RepID=A0ABR5DHH8_9FLAO|nr:membrane protein [Aequorivita vladivostokensis]KJJ38236.1 membrane protein [Aequorivita vladivostokensis]
MKKVAEVTLVFWIMKICATTLGETAGDMLSMTFNIGYGLSSIILIGFFIATLIAQLSVKKYIPVLYWLVIIATSTAGTTMSDFMDRTLGLGYATGASILAIMLVSMLFVWYKSEGSLSVTDIKNFRPEMFYWITILISNTLGTALGDYLADDSGLGFSGGAFLIGSLILITALLHFFSKISNVILFWIAFVLTRPFGATFGDLLTKSTDKGGLDLGTIGSSAVLFGVLTLLIFYVSVKLHRERIVT